jgi:hypothetical protein
MSANVGESDLPRRSQWAGEMIQRWVSLLPRFFPTDGVKLIGIDSLVDIYPNSALLLL